MESDILARLRRWYDRVPSDSAIFGCSSKTLDDAVEEIERLRAELADAIKQRDEAAAWRPIETAPMNGTVVMLYGHGRVTVGSWVAVVEYSMSPESLSGIGDDHPEDESAFWESHDGGFTEEHPPTHWMPLPQPPREKEGGGA